MQIKNFKRFTALTPEQKESRNKGIGGSDAAAVLGQSKYKTPLDIYKDKIGEGDGFEGNLSTALGDYLETFIMDMYSDSTGIEFVKPDSSVEMVHKDYPWMRCNLDFVSKDKSIVGEIKTTSNGNAWGKEGTDEMPTEYLIQCAHNRIVSESHFGVEYKTFPCVVLIQGFGSPKLKEFIYTKNESLEALMIEKERILFKEHVEKRIPPCPTNRKDIDIPIDQIVDEAVIADELSMDLYDQHNKISSEIKGLKDQDEMIKAQLAQTLNEKTTLVNRDGDRLVTWKPVTSNKFDSKSFKLDKPELYQAYIKTSQSRTMRFA